MSRLEWRFEEAASSVLKKVKIVASESITLIQSSVNISFCEFSHFNSQVIKYLNCNPIILHCDFHDNRQAAINSAVNVTGSPIICYNRFYHNVLDNTNQPQINLGPGTAGRDIIIEGNTIEGCSPMSGGIAIANLMNVGPTQAVIRNNIVETRKKNLYPGYVFVEMIMTDYAWYVVRNTPGVTGFVGSSGKGTKPFPVPREQIEPVLKRMGEIDADMFDRYSIDDYVKVIHGPLEGTEGRILSINRDTKIVELETIFFGRSTRVEVDFSEIDKI